MHLPTHARISGKGLCSKATSTHNLDLTEDKAHLDIAILDDCVVVSSMRFVSEIAQHHYWVDCTPQYRSSEFSL